ncbi:MAG: Crp/Fnr family transcriptional regulator [Rhodospirillales bacterium]|nr:Crp/Fnr family transcriptional regulator [Rhodospirillales bacterium]MDP7215407.1 Crp/Fnr family transcriptional regulator [Rhodospirillales bacterium]HIJ42978.1 Crp/Fnr family transcriptional regulator [Rhodospirillaceae bacterium]HIJ92121.1 Crp/Fnr family transcriptional regulator [Rhodospirillaceae bacterium]
MAERTSYFEQQARSLADISVLAEVPPKMIADLEKKCEWQEFAPNDIILDVSDTTTNLYFVVKGKVKAVDFISESRQVALAELGKGSSFGELAAVDLKKRSARITAVEPTLVASLSSKEFRSLLIASPETALALLKRFAGYIRTLNTRLTTLSTLSPHQRVYYELLRIAEPNTLGDGSWIVSNIPNHAAIADWIGADKEIVAQAIGKLARDGIVERKHKNLIIKDHPRLQRLADQH